jgi:hypothetical protein
MPNLLVSFYITQQRTDPFGQRVWDDGLAENYRTSRRGKGEDGIFRTVPVPPDWYRVASLNPTQVGAVSEAIDAAAVDQIPAEITAVEEGSDDISSAVWEIRTPEGVRTIRVAQWGPLDPAAKPLMDLLMRMTTVVNLAAAGLDSVPASNNTDGN